MSLFGLPDEGHRRRRRVSIGQPAKGALSHAGAGPRSPVIVAANGLIFGCTNVPELPRRTRPPTCQRPTGNPYGAKLTSAAARVASASAVAARICPLAVTETRRRRGAGGVHAAVGPTRRATTTRTPATPACRSPTTSSAGLNRWGHCALYAALGRPRLRRCCCARRLRRQRRARRRAARSFETRWAWASMTATNTLGSATARAAGQCRRRCAAPSPRPKSLWSSRSGRLCTLTTLVERRTSAPKRSSWQAGQRQERFDAWRESALRHVQRTAVHLRRDHRRLPPP